MATAAEDVAGIPANVASASVTPPSRDDLMILAAELRECYQAATLQPDGRTKNEIQRHVAG